MTQQNTQRDFEILLVKYQQAMGQLGAAQNAIFELKAELQLALARLSELEDQNQKEKGSDQVDGN